MKNKKSLLVPLIGLHILGLVLLINRFGMTLGSRATLGLSAFVWLMVALAVYPMRKSNIWLDSFFRIALVGSGLALLVILVCLTLIHTEVESRARLSGDVDYMVILGAGLRGDQLSKRLQMRLDTGLDLLAIASETKSSGRPMVIVSGGQGPDEWISEAEAMAKYLESKGLSRNQIILEDQSTSTQENLLFSSQLMDKEEPSVIIITSDYHMYRAKMLASRLDWEVQGQSAVNPLSVRLNYLFREVLALCKDIILKEF